MNVSGGKGWSCGFVGTVIAASILMCIVSPVLASEVVLTNGDRLTGTIDTITGGKLQLKSPLLGKVEIDMIHVQSISSDELVPVVMSDGRTIVRRLGPSTQGKVALQDEQKQKEEVGWDQIKEVNPAPKEPPVWKGSVSGGITSIHGNSKSDAAQASLSISKREESSRTTINGDYGRSTNRDEDTGDDVTTEDWWKTGAKFDYFLTKKLYGYLEGRYAVDKVADLDQRIIGGAGLGYQWVESKKMNFSTEGGLAYITEKYKDDGTDEHMTAQLGYHFDKQLTDTLSFRHDLSYFPGLDEFSDYYLTTSLELRAGLTKSMFANLRTIFDYDATPAEGKGSSDIKYMLGVGWDF